MDKKFLASVCAVVVGASCMGISALADNTEDTSAKTGLTSFEPTTDNVKTIGRTYYNGESLWFSHSAAGVEFTFTGTTAKITVTADASAIGTENGARIVVYADGERVKDVMQTVKTQIHTVTLDEGTHTIKVLKASESANGSILIDSIAVDGDSISPTEEKTHSIEFIGDSITCGYGIDGTTKDSFCTKTEDGTRTYAYKTAQLFDADYSMVSVSGSGIVSGYTNGSNANTSNLMPDFYGLLGHSWGWIDGKNIDEVEWDFDSYTPDLIVINLGTNDASYTDGDADRIAEFTQSYVDFLKQVREANPDSEILCTLGIMGQDLYTAIEDAVAAYTEETDDTRVNAFEFDVQDTTTNGVGTDWHPSEGSHVDAANALAAKITELYGWETDETVDISASEELLVATVDEDPEVPEEDNSSDSDDSEDSSSASSSSDDSSASSDSSSTASADSTASTASTASAASTAVSSAAVSVSSAAASTSSTVSSVSDANPTTGLKAIGAAVALIGVAGIVVSRKKK